MHSHHDHSRRLIVTIGFAATLLAAVTTQHDERRAAPAHAVAQVAVAH